MHNKQIGIIISTLTELIEDISVPKSIKIRIQEIIDTLKEENVLSIKINKVLNDLDEIATDVNLQPYTRTQIWNVVSMLEKIEQI